MPNKKSLKKKPVCSFYGVMPNTKKYLGSNLKDFEVNISQKPLDPEKIDPKTNILGVFVDSKVDKKIIDKLKQLKLIVTLSTGYDHISLSAAKKRKIPVCNVPTYGENTVAQHTLSLILALSRKLFQSVKRVKEGIYDYHGLRGFDLKNKTIGVIGTGHIGLHLMDMLKGFEANVIAFDVFPKKELQEKYNFKYTSLNKLISTSDIISLHVPLLPNTEHIINKKAIKKMKKGVYIINTARGGLIDSEALLWGLQNKYVAGAGLDVLEDEGFIQDPETLLSNECKTCDIRVSLMNNMIIDHPNTIVTPHNAFNSQEALRRITDTTVANINGFMEGKIQNDVTKKKH